MPHSNCAKVFRISNGFPDPMNMSVFLGNRWEFLIFITFFGIPYWLVSLRWIYDNFTTNRLKAPPVMNVRFLSWAPRYFPVFKKIPEKSRRLQTVFSAFFSPEGKNPSFALTIPEKNGGCRVSGSSASTGVVSCVHARGVVSPIFWET